MTRRKPKSEHKRDGRPTVMTPEVIAKLEVAFSNAFTDEMACLYAGVSADALYDYCRAHPKFGERKETLKRTPDIKAQATLVRALETSENSARWWAEHRMPDFMPKSKVEHGGVVKVEDSTATEAMRAVALRYEEELRQAILDGGGKKA